MKNAIEITRLLVNPFQNEGVSADAGLRFGADKAISRPFLTWEATGNYPFGFPVASFENRRRPACVLLWFPLACRRLVMTSGDVFLTRLFAKEERLT